jgi:hypothetical protein
MIRHITDPVAHSIPTHHHSNLYSQSSRLARLGSHALRWSRIPNRWLRCPALLPRRRKRINTSLALPLALRPHLRLLLLLDPVEHHLLLAGAHGGVKATRAYAAAPGGGRLVVGGACCGARSSSGSGSGGCAVRRARLLGIRLRWCSRAACER